MARVSLVPVSLRIGILALMLACMAAMRPAPVLYTTYDGIGPDKWASVWLITRHIEPDAEVRFLPPNSVIRAGIPFDVPGSRYSRDESATTFERLVEGHQISDEIVREIAGVVRDMEIGAWGLVPGDEAAVVERAFRGLQREYGREGVPLGCYMTLFDRLEDMIGTGGAVEASRDLQPGSECAAAELDRIPEDVVPELDAEAILLRIARGERVLFVDTREDAEFAEYHIPGAVVIRLRDVDAAVADSLQEYDLVVPYCVKDFRGYEVARALQGYGLSQVAIMNPFGIKGWRSLGLPVSGSAADSEPDGLAALDRCANDVASCLERASS